MFERLCFIVAFAVTSHALAAPSAQPVAKQVSDLQACRALSDSAARLACYDRAADALTTATASQEIVIVERSEVRKTRKGLFGFTLPKIGFLAGRADNRDDQADMDRLETKVVTSRALPYGKWRFTVESGAVWDTVEASFAFDDPLPGRTVLLERGALGSYFAKVGKGRRVQAKRVQ